MDDEATFEVQLAIYDLSNGKSSPCKGFFQMMGISSITMDVVPHTGIIVYGKYIYLDYGDDQMFFKSVLFSQLI